MTPPIPRSQAIAELTAPGEPLALETVVVDGRAQRRFVHAPTSLRALYQSAASDAPFIVAGDERLTYAEAWRETGRIAQVLVRRCGVGRGDRVAIAMRNHPEWMLSFMAVTAIGAVAVAVNAMWQAEELVWSLVDCGAKVLIADSERLARLARVPLPAALQRLAVRVQRADDLHGATPLHACAAALDDATMPAVEPASDDWASFFYTSGSTGRPKAVVSTHRQIISALLSWELDARIGERVSGVAPPQIASPGTLLAIPLFHVTGCHAVFLASFRAHRRIVCLPRWDAEAAAAAIVRERLHSFVAPAAMTGDLVRVAAEGRHDLSSLLGVGGGGAPRAPEQVRRIAQSFGQAVPITGWGMTETNAIGAGIAGDDYLAHPASSGRCSQLLELKVVDEQGRSLPAGERGELLVRGTSVFAGYWNGGALDASALVDGWFRTGDVAVIDGEGFVTIVDRIKDLIIRGGENIGCAHIEAVLAMHPEVIEAAVYAVPDERLGEEVGATVHGTAALDLEALQAFAAEHLGAFEVPRRWRESAHPLPRTASGKIDKRRVRAAALGAAG